MLTHPETHTERGAFLLAGVPREDPRSNSNWRCRWTWAASTPNSNPQKLLTCRRGGASLNHYIIALENPKEKFALVPLTKCCLGKPLIIEMPESGGFCKHEVFRLSSLLHQCFTKAPNTWATFLKFLSTFSSLPSLPLRLALISLVVRLARSELMTDAVGAADCPLSSRGRHWAMNGCMNGTVRFLRAESKASLIYMPAYAENDKHEKQLCSGIHVNIY